MIKVKLVIWLLLLPQLLLAQVIVTGIVQDEDSGETLPFANITVKGSYIGSATNLDGHFTLLSVPTDTSTLIVSYVGYEIKELKLSKASSAGRLTIKLKATTSALQEVVITEVANKFLNVASGVSHATLATKQLSLLPSIGEVDIFRSLQLLPGVSGTNENSSGLFVRGGTPDQNLVVLDGITVYKVDHFFGFFSAFNANAIKDVQLYKGAFPSKYGGRISSVVDLSGKTGNYEKTRGEFGLNLISANAVLEVPLSKKLSFLFAGRRSFTDVLQSGVYKKITGNLLNEDPFPGLPNLVNTNINVVAPTFYFYDWNSKITFKPNDKDLFTVSFYQGKDFLDKSRSFTRTIERQVGNPILILGDIKENTNWGNSGVSGKWSRQWNPKFYSHTLIAASEYFSKYDRKGYLDITIPAQDSTLFAGQEFTYEDNKVSDLSARIDNEFLVSSKHKLDFGFSFTQSAIRYQNIRNDTLLILDKRQKTNYTALYFSDTWQPNSRITVTGGVRATYYEMTDDFLVEPRLSGSLKLTDQLKIKAAFGRHFQFINQITNENITGGSRDFWLLADNDQVAVSSATHLIGGISYENNGWLFDTEAYHKDLKGLSEFSLRFRTGAAIDLNQLFYQGTGTAKGVEFLAQKKSGNYTGWISYTLGRVTYFFPELNYGQKFPALHDQRHEYKMVHSYQIAEWSFAATFIYGSGKPFSEPAGKYSLELLDGKAPNYISVGPKNGSRLPAYHRLDISVHHFFPMGKKLRGDLGFSVFNLYNRTNTWYKEYDFSQQPVLVTEVRYLGITPNISLSVKF